MFAKRVWFATAFTISLLMVAMQATRADSKEEAHKAIQSAYARMDAALNGKDINTFYSFYTSDYIMISQNGEKKSLEKSRRGLSQILANPNIKSTNYMCTIEKLILEGDTATVFGNEMITLITVDSQTGSNNVEEINGRVLQTWVKQNGRWLMNQREALTSEATINGNPVTQEAQPGLAQQNIPPTRTLKSQQPGNNQLPLSKQTKNYTETPPEILHIPLPTERYFLTTSSNIAVTSLAFSYPSSWSVQTNPPGIYGDINAVPPQVVDQMMQRFDIIAAPREDPRQATHYSNTTSLVQGVVNPQELCSIGFHNASTGFA